MINTCWITAKIRPHKMIKVPSSAKMNLCKYNKIYIVETNPRENKSP